MKKIIFMEKQYNWKRPNIPANITRIIEVEAGHKCSIKNCYDDHTYLEIHHINQNREDNSVDNLISLLNFDTNEEYLEKGYITCSPNIN